MKAIAFHNTIKKYKTGNMQLTCPDIKAKLSRNDGQFRVSYSCSSFRSIDPTELFRSLTRMIIASNAASCCFSSLCIFRLYSENNSAELNLCNLPLGIKINMQ
jgi:hypothetical protein